MLATPLEVKYGDFLTDPFTTVGLIYHVVCAA